MQESVFIQRECTDVAQADDWIMFLVNNYSTMSNELNMLDTRTFKESVDIISLPVRLRGGLYGNWVDTQKLALSRLAACTI